MQTRFNDEFLNTPIGQQIDAQFRACVHCGFCNATCPTYQLTGNELDGPRGRIYLMQSMLEGHATSELTQTHLDRCLSCLSCETTCPSGVRYGELQDYAQLQLKNRNLRARSERLSRWLLRSFLSKPQLLSPLWKLGLLFKPLLPKRLKLVALATITQLPQPVQTMKQSARQQVKKVLLLQGCVQSVAAPHVNTQMRSLLTQSTCDCQQDDQENCCGALHYHNGDQVKAKQIMRSNILRWSEQLNAGTENIVIAASGCAQMIRQYAKIFAHEPETSAQAAQISAALVDAGSLIQNAQLQRSDEAIHRVALHIPCTLQHGLKVDSLVQQLLIKCGYELLPIQDAHLCCGSAGTYSLLQPELSQKLLKNKVRHLTTGQPDCIATANIGCQLHLQSSTRTAVVHWLELIKIKPDVTL